MSRNSSLLAVGVDAVVVNLAWSSLSACCNNSTNYAAQGCAFEMRCGITDSAGYHVVVESEALSAFTAHYLRDRETAAVRKLIAIGMAPLSLHCSGHAATALVD